jgi:hypothetical protein
MPQMVHFESKSKANNIHCASGQARAGQRKK